MTVIKKILILAANPKGTTPLRLGEEVREIDEGLRRAKKRDQFSIQQRWEVRSRDIYRAMLDVNPTFLHFCGHGSGDQGLAFENESGQIQLETAESLAALFDVFSERGIECVVLNACYSEVQAKAISQYISYVVGMNNAISDRSSIAFAVAFYDALGAGEPVEFAYKLACSQLIRMDESDIPILLKKSSSRATLRSLPRQNLPPQTNEFVGRESELKRLMEILSESHAAHIVTIDGIGGVGKTALVIEAAYRCLEASHDESILNIPIFKAVIFTSAKESYLLPTGITPRIGTERTLRDIYRAISITLDDPTITQATPEDQLERVQRCLSKQHVLLIVDNLETIENKDSIIGFLYDLPRTVKSVITTREQTVIHAPIRLDCLLKIDSLKLIQQQLTEKSVVLTEAEQEQLYTLTSGIPAVILYAIGRLACSDSLETVLEDLSSATGEVARFCFEKSFEELDGQLAQKLLMALSIFHTSPIRDALVEVAGLKTEPMMLLNKALERLQQLSLVQHQAGRYGMLPLTRDYVLAKLSSYPALEKEMRQRWVSWYINYAEEYGRDAWEEWQVKYDYLEVEWQNIQAVLDWCAVQNRYTDIKELWQRVNRYANIYVCWDDRVLWHDWLAHAAERRGDWATFVYALSRQGWTLTLAGREKNLEEANKILIQAWELRHHADLGIQDYLAKSLAALCIRQGRYTEAHHWLDMKEALVNQANFEDKDRIRYSTTVPYYRAEIYYLEGNYEAAKELYQQVRQQARDSDYQRRFNYAQNRLAEIAIKQDDLEEAEKLLQPSLDIANRNKDQRLVTSYQRSYAYLEKKRGNLGKAREWATEALNGFNRFGMTREEEEMRSLLSDLNRASS
ncbi:tetratricopeptide repeat protein [Leptothoe sp. PORK10 BA2]|uniref:tetratricopeptide repeat protein n=1 Tax=Leptothoe sp. PORK10 BA2 TaxID=3110254 RepID=UPI002B2188CB|nr:NB-ARC domain-containing protein [Leptothoe sp. PORK10 BA2]MEA5466365.1 NB-ARC domain-containing protein [Leptothoe sp. PORK10 BA2]